MDRYGALKVVSFAIVGEAFAFFLIGVAPAQFSYYAAAIVTLAVLGTGTTPPGFARMVTARFDAARGLALGVMIGGLGLMAITGPLWATWLISAIGWRGGYMAISALVLLLGGIGVLLIRSEAGRDQVKAPEQAIGAALEPEQAGSFAALKRPLFWLMLAGFLAPAFFCMGYGLHLISLLRERGLSAEAAAQVQSLIGVAILLGRLGSGAALDRFPPTIVAATAFTISGLGCALLLLPDPRLMAVAALAIGLTIGAELDLVAYFISRYFGLASFGRLYGVAYGGLITAGGASPVLIAFIAARGGYDNALIVSTIGTIAGAAILLSLPSPRGAAQTGIAAQKA
jgi:MFS family permease